MSLDCGATSFENGKTCVFEAADVLPHSVVRVKAQFKCYFQNLYGPSHFQYFATVFGLFQLQTTNYIRSTFNWTFIDFQRIHETYIESQHTQIID